MEGFLFFLPCRHLDTAHVKRERCDDKLSRKARFHCHVREPPSFVATRWPPRNKPLVVRGEKRTGASGICYGQDGIAFRLGAGSTNIHVTRHLSAVCSSVTPLGFGAIHCKERFDYTLHLMRLPNSATRRLKCLQAIFFLFGLNRNARRTAAIKLLVQGLALASNGGCWLALDGCSALGGATQCSVGTSQCTITGRQTCQDTGTSGIWVDAPCPSGQTYCVTTNVYSAECALTPHCASTATACGSSGLCADGPNGCVATEAGCANSTSCPVFGTCGFDGENCVTTAAGCLASQDCVSNGLCGFSAGSCASTDAGCVNSTGCKTNGLCAVSPINGCEATVEGCAASDGCINFGFCGVSDSSCVATAEGCKNSTRCQQAGVCTLAGSVCEAS